MILVIQLRIKVQKHILYTIFSRINSISLVGTARSFVLTF